MNKEGLPKNLETPSNLQVQSRRPAEHLASPEDEIIKQAIVDMYASIVAHVADNLNNLYAINPTIIQAIRQSKAFPDQGEVSFNAVHPTQDEYGNLEYPFGQHIWIVTPDERAGSAKISNWFAEGLKEGFARLKANGRNLTPDQITEIAVACSGLNSYTYHEVIKLGDLYDLRVESVEALGLLAYSDNPLPKYTSETPISQLPILIAQRDDLHGKQIHIHEPTDPENLVRPPIPPCPYTLATIATQVKKALGRTDVT